MRDIFDESLDELIERGYIEKADTDGERICRLTDKAGEQARYQIELRKALASNSSAEILKRIAKSY